MDMAKMGENVQAERQNKKGLGCFAVSPPLAFRASGKNAIGAYPNTPYIVKL